MSELQDLLDGLRDDPTCVFAPPSGAATPSFAVPADLRQFYEICGGLVLFSDAPFVWEIVPPRELVPSNPEIVGEQVDDDITASWFIVARQPADSWSFISIDLGADRLGWCYDSNVGNHGQVGDCAILAHSFTELLAALIASRGESIFWEDDGFTSKGDAYDAIDNATR